MCTTNLPTFLHAAGESNLTLVANVDALGFFGDGLYAISGGDGPDMFGGTDGGGQKRGCCVCIPLVLILRLIFLFLVALDPHSLRKRGEDCVARSLPTL